MGTKREKGKIAKSEWPAIVERHRGGESLARIARSYGCTAPAIRYIIDRHDARGARPRKGFREEARADVPAGVPIPEMRASPDHQRASLPERNGVIESEVRSRVTTDIASFLVALENASRSRDEAIVRHLFEATDRLLRAAARVMLELEGDKAEPTKVVPIAQKRAGRNH